MWTHESVLQSCGIYRDLSVKIQQLAVSTYYFDCAYWWRDLVDRWNESDHFSFIDIITDRFIILMHRKYCKNSTNKAVNLLLFTLNWWLSKGHKHEHHSTTGTFDLSLPQPSSKNYLYKYLAVITTHHHSLLHQQATFKKHNNME